MVQFFYSHCIWLLVVMQYGDTVDMCMNERDAGCSNSADDDTSPSTRDDDEAFVSCFDFQQTTRSCELSVATSCSTPRSLLTRMLCSRPESGVRCVTSVSSTQRSGTAASTSPRPLVLPSPSCVTGRAVSRCHCQVPADSSLQSDVTGHVTVRDPRLMTSRCGHTKHKQRSQQQQQQKMTMAEWMYYVQPTVSSSSMSGLHRKRASFRREVQVIEIDQTQRVCRTGAALSRHTEQLRESQSDTVD